MKNPQKAHILKVQNDFRTIVTKHYVGTFLLISNKLIYETVKSATHVLQLFVTYFHWTRDKFETGRPFVQKLGRGTAWGVTQVTDDSSRSEDKTKPKKELLTR